MAFRATPFGLLQATFAKEKGYSSWRPSAKGVKIEERASLIILVHTRLPNSFDLGRYVEKTIYVKIAKKLAPIFALFCSPTSSNVVPGEFSVSKSFQG